MERTGEYLRRVVGALLVTAALAVPRASLAQTASASMRATPPPDTSSWFVDVNFAGAVSSLALPRTFSSAFIQFGESATTKASYPRPSQANPFPIDVSAGYLFLPWGGIGLGYSRTAYQDAATLAAEIPDPNFFNALASATGATGQLNRRETAVHLFVSLLPVHTRRTEVRLCVGPSWFQYTADMVSAVTYTQTSSAVNPQNVIAVTGATTQTVHGGSGVGFNLGGDFTHFFTSRLGIAIGGRLDRGSVKIIQEPLSTVAQMIRTGGGRIFVGLRLRLG